MAIVLANGDRLGLGRVTGSGDGVSQLGDRRERRVEDDADGARLKVHVGLVDPRDLPQLGFDRSPAAHSMQTGAAEDDHVPAGSRLGELRCFGATVSEKVKDAHLAHLHLLRGPASRRVASVSSSNGVAV
jgi:hypothetical protein